MTATLLIGCFVMILAGMLFGFKRGIGKTTVRLVLLLLSAGLSFALAKWVCRAFGNQAMGYVMQFLASKQEFAGFLANNPDLSATILVLCEVLAAPILFAVCYWVLKGVTYVPWLLLCSIFGIGKPGNRTLSGRLGGMCVGAVVGVVSVFVLCVPLLGYTELAVGAVDQLQKAELAQEEMLAQIHVQDLEKIGKTPILSPMYSSIGAPLFDGLTTGDANGSKMVLKQELTVAIEAVGRAKSLQGRPIAEYGEAETEALKGIAQSTGDSVVISQAASSALRDLSKAWMASEAFFGIHRPVINQQADIVINGVLEVFSTSDVANIESDLTSIAEIFGLCVKYDLFACFEDGADQSQLLTRVAGGFLGELRDKIKENPRMLPIYRAVSNVGMSMMVEQLGGTPGNYIEEHPALMNDIAGALNALYNEDGSVNKEAFAQNVSDILADNAVSVPTEAIELIADGIAEIFTKEELDTMTDEEIKQELVDRLSDASVAAELAAKYKDQLPEGYLP